MEVVFLIRHFQKWTAQFDTALSEPNTISNGDFEVRATFSAKWLIKLFWVAFLAVCSRFFEWPFFLKSLDLSNEGGVEIGSDVNYQACQVVPGRTAYLDYQLENKWARVYPEIFKVERVQGKLVFKVFLSMFFREIKAFRSGAQKIFIYCQQPPVQPDPNLIALSPLLIFTCKKLLKGSNLPYGPVRQFWNWVNVHEVSREYIIISWKSLKNWNMSAIFAKLKMVLNCWIGFFSKKSIGTMFSWINWLYSIFGITFDFWCYFHSLC